MSTLCPNMNTAVLSVWAIHDFQRWKLVQFLNYQSTTTALCYHVWNNKYGISMTNEQTLSADDGHKTGMKAPQKTCKWTLSKGFFCQTTISFYQV